MKVLHVIPSISHKRGGPSKAVVEMVEALRKLGVDSRIITTTDNGRYRELEQTHEQWIEYRGIPIMLFPSIDSKVKVIREYLISINLLLWLMKNADQYDIIHFHAIFSFPTTFGMLVARKKRIPYVIRTIGQLNEWCLSQSGFRKKAMLALVERGNLEKAICIHVTSEIERLDIRKARLKNKTLLLGLGVDSINHKGAERTHGKVTSFLFLSRVHPKKGLDFLIKSLSELNENSGRWILHVAGDGEEEYMKYIREYAVQLRVNDRISWYGHVTGEQKEELLRRTDWFVLPSANENFGIAALEAMAHGIPVIVSSGVGIFPYIVDYSAGYVFSKNDSKELHHILKFCLTEDRSRMSTNALNLVREEFFWNVIAKKLYSFYKESFICGNQ